MESLDILNKIGEFFVKELEFNRVNSGEPIVGVSNLTVILMGLGVVFTGLIVLIFACYIMGAIFKLTGKNKKEEKPAAAPASVSAPADIPNRGEFIAAVSAAIAEASGTDAAGFRIVKIEKK